MVRSSAICSPRPREIPPTLLLLAVVGCSGAPQERRWDIYELAADPTPENVARIREMLEDPDRDIRATALNKLVGLKVPDAGALAIAGLNDYDGFVRAIKRIL